MKSPLMLLLGFVLIAIMISYALIAKKRIKKYIPGSVARLKVLKILPRYKVLVRRQRMLQVVSWSALAAASLCLVIVAARPTRTRTSSNMTVGLDVMIVLDTSRSMYDYFPSIGKSIRYMTSQFKTDRLGMIAFAGDAQQILPLTDDYTEINNLADKMVTMPPREFRYNYAFYNNGGTDISAGLYLASVRMANLPVERTKVVVLITDGEQTTSSTDDPEGLKDPDFNAVQSAAKKLGQQGIRVYTLSTAGESLGPSGLEESKTLVEGITRNTFGANFDAKDPEASIKVFTEINKLLRKELESKKVTTVYETPWLWIYLALIALTIYFAASSQRFNGGVI